MEKNILEITDEIFESKVINSQGLALVDFWAPWCAPCKAITPILEELSQEYYSQLKIFKVNVDDNQKISTKYNIRGIPTLIFFKDGKNVDTKVGVLSKEELISIIENHL